MAAGMLLSDAVTRIDAVALLVLVALSSCWIVAGTQDFGDEPQEGSASSSDGAGGWDTSVAASSGVGGAEPKLYVFVTSSPHTGDVAQRGLSQVDMLCQSLADASSVAPHRAAWRAWLSTNLENAIDELLGHGPWYLIGTDELVFESKAQIPNGPLVPVNRNEAGEITDSLVWTGTLADGMASADRCQNWLSASPTHYGSVGSSSNLEGWTDARTLLPCDTPARIYCFQGTLGIDQ